MKRIGGNVDEGSFAVWLSSAWPLYQRRVSRQLPCLRRSQNCRLPAGVLGAVIAQASTSKASRSCSVAACTASILGGNAISWGPRAPKPHSQAHMPFHHEPLQTDCKASSMQQYTGRPPPLFQSVGPKGWPDCGLPPRRLLLHHWPVCHVEPKAAPFYGLIQAQHPIKRGQPGSLSHRRRTA